MPMRLSVLFTGNNRDLKKATREGRAELDKFKTTAVNVAGTLAGAYGAATTARAIFDTTKEVERLSSQLAVAMGSMEAGNRKFDQLTKFASDIGANVQEVTRAFVQLRNVGLNPSEDAILSYMNTAGATGKSLEQFVEAVADATMGQYERLNEFGIKARKEGDKVAVSFRGTTEVIGNSAQDIEEYLRSLGENEFGGYMESQLDGVNDALADLNNQWTATVKRMNDAGLGETIADGVDVATNALAGLTEFVDENGDKIINVAKAIAAVYASRMVASVGSASQAFILHAAYQQQVIGRYMRMNGIAGSAAVKLRAVGTAARFASRGMSLLGGPVGVTAMAAFSLYEFVSSAETTEDKIDDLVPKLKQLTEGFDGLTAAQARNRQEELAGRMGNLMEDANQLRSKIADLRQDLEDPFVQLGASQFTAIQQEIARLTQELELNQVEQKGVEAAIQDVVSRLLELKNRSASAGESLKTMNQNANGVDMSNLNSGFEKTIDKLAKTVIELQYTNDEWERWNILQSAGANLTDAQVSHLDDLIDRVRTLKAEANFEGVIDELNNMSEMASMTPEEREEHRFKQKAGYGDLNKEQRSQFDQAWGQYQQAESRADTREQFGQLQSDLNNEESTPLDKLKAEKDARLEIIDQYAQQEVMLLGEAEAMKTRVIAQYENKREALQKQQLMNSLTNGQQLFDGMAGMAKAFAGEQSGIYKTMFAASKAFSIAQSIVAIQSGIAQAANQPFPMNLAAMATVASQTASIVSTIKGTSMGGGGQLQGQAHDGLSRVPMGNEGTYLLKRNEMVLNPQQRENFEKVVNAVRSQRAQGGGIGGDRKPSITINQTINVESKGATGNGDDNEGVEEAVDRANEHLMQRIHDDFASGGPLYQRLKASG
ncbi:hypothetical protein [Idiomarina sp.]|uniref:hypothetical protein n=1 Tax=Idiomarina sp. TaxID=1874361 RepID=UPI0025BEDF75|nr:hypothetical protein [Idiomarina sp.]